MFEKIVVKDMCKVMAHIETKVKTLDIADNAMETKVYEDIYRQALREAGAYTLESVSQEYLGAVHEAIDRYELPAYMRKHD